MTSFFLTVLADESFKSLPSPVGRLGEWAGAGFVIICTAFGGKLAVLAWRYIRSGKYGKIFGWQEDQEIKLLLREARITCGADRAFLAQFENGTHYVSNREKWRYTWSHEDTDQFYSYVAAWRKDISTTLVPEEMKMVDESTPSFKTVGDLAEGAFRHMCAEIGTEAVARCVIRRSNNDDPLGFIGLDFAKLKPTTPPSGIEKLPYYAGRLERILSRSRK